MNSLKFKYMDIIDVDLELKQHKTVLNGDNATGKTYLYNIIEQYAQEENRKDIMCLNIDNANNDYADYVVTRINKIKDGLIVIDNGDIVLRNKKLHDCIDLDNKNHYIIMSRQYYSSYSELAKLIVSKDNISLRYKINTD